MQLVAEVDDVQAVEALVVEFKYFLAVKAGQLVMTQVGPPLVS